MKDKVDKLVFIHTPPNGARETVNIKDGKITYTFTAQTESTQFLIYKDVAGQSDVDLNVTIEKAILVEGNKSYRVVSSTRGDFFCFTRL